MIKITLIIVILLVSGTNIGTPPNCYNETMIDQNTDEMIETITDIEGEYYNESK